MGSDSMINFAEVVVNSDIVILCVISPLKLNVLMSPCFASKLPEDALEKSISNSGIVIVLLTVGVGVPHPPPPPELAG